MGDARGHWEGDTLVVETTNFKDQIAYRNANGDTLRLIERFTPIGPNTRRVVGDRRRSDDMDEAVDVRHEPDEEGRDTAAVRIRVSRRQLRLEKYSQRRTRGRESRGSRTVWRQRQMN